VSTLLGSSSVSGKYGPSIQIATLTFPLRSNKAVSTANTLAIAMAKRIRVLVVMIAPLVVICAVIRQCLISVRDPVAIGPPNV
jgi:hypothetical protein